MNFPWRIPLILAVTTFIHYLDRNALAIALPLIANEYHWTEKEIGLYGEYVLGAFYLSFGVSQILLSGVVERWNIKAGLALSIGGFSVVTMLFYPFGDSLLMLTLLRLLLGAAESLHMPMNSAIVARTFPPTQRGRANSIYLGGILLSLMFGPLCMSMLIQAVGWRLSFAILGLTGLMVALPLVVWGIPSFPPAKRNMPTPLKLPLSFWLYTAAGSANAFCVFGMLNWLPSYLSRARGIPFEGLSLPLFAVFASGVGGILLWAWIGDRAQRRLEWAIAGLTVAGICVSLTALPISTLLTLLLLTLGVFFQSSYNAQEFATLQERYPSCSAGAVTGLYNGLSVLIGGVGGSLLPGLILAITGSFQNAILSIAGGAFLVAGLLLLFSHSQKV
ncbi:MAG: MFS transporter [Bacteroidia bacterium]|nr:MFS transporter [Bacteroidia bacterium]MDW8014968.1 MFS transporter [Bacteroidia bacterium]